MGSKEKAQDGHNEFNRRAQQSSADFKRASDLSHSTFQSSNQSRNLDSGRTSTSEPAQATGGGSLDFITMTVFAATSMLGAAAVAKVLGSKSR